MSDTSTRPDPPSPDRSRLSLVGQTLSGRYKVESLLGSGGMGSVYSVTHTAMRKRYALKILNEQTAQVPELVARFEREALAAAHLEHPNIAAAIDFGKTEDGAFYLVLEYLEGQRLRDALESGPLDVRRAMHITRQIAAALERSHQLGIIHRDLKPENVMLVSRQGDRDFVKVLDFGLAKVEKAEPGSDAPAQVLTRHGMVCGTPRYMAPEQCVGQPLDGRADLYALGLVLFEMLTGVHPFPDQDISRVIRHQLTTPTPALSKIAPNISVPASLEAVVQRLTHKQPDARYENATALLAALADVAEREGILPPELSSGAITPAPRPASPATSADGSAHSVAAADVLSLHSVTEIQKTSGAGAAADAKTIHSLEIVAERPVGTPPPLAAPKSPPATTVPVIPAASQKPDEAKTVAALPKAAPEPTRPAMAAATLAAFQAAKPEDDASKPAGSADAAAAANWPAPLRQLHSHLPPSLQSLPASIWLGVPLLCLTLVLFLLLRACGD
jgi:serine/threonine protein kinase